MRKIGSYRGIWMALAGFAAALLVCGSLWAALTWSAGNAINDPEILTPSSGSYYGLNTAIDLGCNTPNDTDHWEDGDQEPSEGDSADDSVAAKWNDGNAGGYFPDGDEGMAVTYVTPSVAGTVTLGLAFDDFYTAKGDDAAKATSVAINVADAKIVFKVGGVEANAITRGATGTFEVVNGAGNVIPGATYSGWAFRGTDPDVWATEATNLTGTWSGIMVASGKATCIVTINGVRVSAVSPVITVNARAGATWVLAAVGAIPAGDEDAVANWGEYPNHQAPKTLLGQNQDKQTGATDVIQPGPNAGWVNGFTLAQINNGGPNNTLWYVTDTSLFIERRSVINRFCKAGQAGLPDPPAVGWFEKNELDYGKGYLNGLVAGIKAHENMGQGANPKGHQRQLVAESAKAGNDPRKAIEPLAARREIDLKNKATAEILAIENRLIAATTPEPTGNWGPKQVEVHDVAQGWGPANCGP